MDEAADCTAKELSEACGLSAATLSRFRSGERTPDQEGLNLLLQGLCSIAACKGKQLSPDSLYAQCTDCMDLQRSDPEALRTKINRLLTALHISSAELAKAISYDPSFLSRIRSGQRHLPIPSALPPMLQGLLSAGLMGKAVVRP